MSSRVTRSSARLAAGSSNPSPNQSSSTTPTTRSTTGNPKKRKATREPTPEASAQPDQPHNHRQAKRTKASDIESSLAQAPPASARPLRRTGRGTTAMSSAGTPSDPANETSSSTAVAGSKRKGTRRKPNQESNVSTTPPSQSSRKTKKPVNKRDSSADKEPPAQNASETLDKTPAEPAGNVDDLSDDEEPPRDYDQDDQDIFGGRYLGQTPLSIANSLRSLAGEASAGISARLREDMNRLKAKDDPSLQLIALQDLAHLFLVSDGEMIQGHFSPDQCVKELITLMQPNEFGVGSPEVMLLACRCLANLMEVLPASTANVVYGGAVPILCQKLFDPEYIDLAEQAMSTLEKISVEFPSTIVREGGLAGCLKLLDFFPMSTQRTAVTIAANCCRKISDEFFPVIQDAMPTLLTVLSSSDQKVVEQASLCISGIVDSFGHKHEKLEALVNADLLRAILRLLLPGTTNLIGPNIHTQFLRVLSISARASPRLSAELLKMDIVDTLYQILTGVSAPAGTEDMALKIDKNVIMQALVHRPREQVFETLNVICEILPNVERDSLMFVDDLFDAGYPGDDHVSISSRTKDSRNHRRLSLLTECEDELRRFAVVLLPTLTEAYSSTVNLNVRQKVLTAQLKMLSNLDTDILEDALRVVPYASYLASILSQEDHLTLVTYALQAAELLLKRLESIYRYQFYREGVISEISRLADRPLSAAEEKMTSSKAHSSPPPPISSTRGSFSSTEQTEGGEGENDATIASNPSEDEDEEDDHDDGQDDVSASSGSSRSSGQDRPMPPSLSNLQDITTRRARKFVEGHEVHSEKSLKQRAGDLLSDVRALADDIRACYLGRSGTSGTELFARLAHWFEGDALESITSFELLSSGIIDALLDVFTAPKTPASTHARSTFLEVFMVSRSSSKTYNQGDGGIETPFSVLVKKLQDLLSRAEHFEVITVHQNSFENNRTSAASMLAKQLKLKLVADDDSGIPKTFRNIMVAIHAIATFKALDDYLRPRISSTEDLKTLRARSQMPSALGTYATSMFGQRTRAHEGGSTPPVPTLPLTSTGNRPSSARSSLLNKPSTPPPGTNKSPESVHDRSAGLRRSTRKHGPMVQTPPPPPPARPLEEQEGIEEPLECADETRLSDEDNVSNSGDALRPVLDDEVQDPGAVSMEVADEGEKVTVRREDGTRVPTPLQGPPGSTLTRQSIATASPSTRPDASTPTSSIRRAMSYAAAVQATPQDWHIEFSVNDQPIPNDTTIYRAVHFSRNQSNEFINRALWSSIHTIKFKRVPGPPVELSAASPSPDAGNSGSGLPQSLDKNPATSAILRLLSILHELNANMEDVLAEGPENVHLRAEPLAQFVNAKLTAKLNRQLEEPLIVASNCLPAWSEDLARLYPFLFPFETRHLFLQSTSFGYSRSMSRWQNSSSTADSRSDRRRDERQFLGRLQRQKVRISRTKMLQSAAKVMEQYGSLPSMLEVEYFEEVGTGLGPTLEFYSTVSKEFARKNLKLWRESESSDSDEFAFGRRGLFPAPMSADQAETPNGQTTLKNFRLLGIFVARSMLDSRIIDISFNPTFFRVGEGSRAVAPSLGAVASVDEQLAKSLKILKQFASLKQHIDEDTTLTPAQKVQKIADIEIDDSGVEDMGLDFTLPGYPSIELLANGSNTPVTIDNVNAYVDSVVDFTLGSGVQRQVDAFRAGFTTVFPYTALRAFTPDELVILFGQAEEDWSLETLLDSVRADHGYHLDSRSVRNLLQIMSEYTLPARREFLQFITGSPKLPIGGFKALTPILTVVCKHPEGRHAPDDELPSVMTCVNYLKLPDYSSQEVMRGRLGLAIRDGQGAFHLS
ncbi:MAG: Ubiquitin fusion degradation protein 4 [Bathelium mastoideum]|nr:MAG: Ubiquitin fusion degradation protein 4 [Bathelium mastoideum]